MQRQECHPHSAVSGIKRDPILQGIVMQPPVRASNDHEGSFLQQNLRAFLQQDLQAVFAKRWVVGLGRVVTSYFGLSPLSSGYFGNCKYVCQNQFYQQSLPYFLQVAVVAKMFTELLLVHLQQWHVNQQCVLEKLKIWTGQLAIFWNLFSIEKLQLRVVFKRPGVAGAVL